MLCDKQNIDQLCGEGAGEGIVLKINKILLQQKCFKWIHVTNHERMQIAERRQKRVRKEKLYEHVTYTWGKFFRIYISPLLQYFFGRK